MTDASDASALMPAAFFGHGNPMNALEVNRYSSAWRAFGQAVPRPRVILVVSAHWYINATAVTAMPRPRTIHDFYGFPRELFDVQYPAPGLPELATEIKDVVKPTWVGADVDSWGIDHGTWSVLVHAFPDASIPVVQLSVNADKDLDYHLELGRKLAPLRKRGVLVVASGNVVHNLRAVKWTLADDGYDWARRFDEDSWGLDHGTWSVLLHAFPKADVPVVQLSIHAGRDFDFHLDLGARLGALRERGVLILGSGNVVHNLRQLDWSHPDAAFDWARRFDEAARETLTSRPAELPRLQKHPDYARSVPTPDHFLPLLYIAGVASATGRPLEALIDGYAYGSLSMAAYTLDAAPPARRADRVPAAGVPDPSLIPPEDTNL